MSLKTKTKKKPVADKPEKKSVLDEHSNAVMKKIADFLDKFSLSLDRIFAAFMASLLLAYIGQLLSQKDAFMDLNKYYENISFGGFFAILIVAFIVLVGVTALLKQRVIIPWALLLSAFAVSVLYALNLTEMIPNMDLSDGVAGKNEANVYFCIGIGIIDFFIVLWEVREDKLCLSKIRIDRKVALAFAAVVFVVSTIVFGYYTSLKYKGFVNSAFDFGIFAQMYEQMASSFEPNTTVERARLMSHFGVHFSPIFYLFLPLYFIFRSPVFLYYLQAGAVAAGVFAVYLICGKMGFSGKLTLAIEALYAFYPCLFNGTFYDFHENKFLTTIILFLFYFIIAKKTVWQFVFAFMLLMVKEDAAIYLIAIALFVMLYRKEVLRGLLMFLMAVVYFIIALQIVKASGPEGVMMDRLSAYAINGEQTFGSVVKAVFFDIGYLIKMMFTTEKLRFILWMFAPVLFAPFMTKKVSSLVLLFPIIPINIMQTWAYQYHVDYQYTYGVAAMVLVSTIFIIGQLKTDTKRVVVLAALFMSVVMSIALVAPKIKTCKQYAENAAETGEQVDELIAEIPSDASVTCSSNLMPHLYRIKWLYSTGIPQKYQAYRTDPELIEEGLNVPLDTDYFIIDTRYSSDEIRNTMNSTGKQYELLKKAGFAELYQKK